jgi:1-acyl-sn-glycerol-3-phosphate acyltransferase
MKKLKKVKSILLLWLLAYPLWLVSGLLFFTLRLLGCVVVHNQKNISFWPKSLIVISNHPSMWEPVLLNYLFFLKTTIQPFKFVPYSTPDLDNYNKWYWELVKGRFIFVPRHKPDVMKSAFKKMANVLRKGKILIIFPEGGRTATHKDNNWYYSRLGHRLRPLKDGAARLALETNAEILIVWINGAEKALPVGRFWPKFWKRTDIYIGPTIKLTGDYQIEEDVKKGTEEIAQALLDLADQTGPVSKPESQS